MSYEYTDRMDAQLRIHDDKGDVLFVCETAKGEFGGVLLPDSDAPRIALEILKAAGWVTTSGSIGGDLEAVALANESEARRALLKRRDELANEFAPRDAALKPNWYGNVSDGLRAAIDRIIELEQAAS